MSRPEAYHGNEPYIFVSYAHKDNERVWPLIEGLQKRGMRVWYDEGLEVGNHWGRVIAQHLSKCQCVLAFVTDSFLQSENCLDEVHYAKGKGKGPLIAYLDKLTLSDEWELAYSRFHALNLLQFTDIESFLDELCETQEITACRAINDENHTPDGAELEACLQKGNECYKNKNYVEAIKWYCQAAEGGHTLAQCNLGHCYEYGKGVDQDEEEAVMWYRKAATQGNAYAQYKLGMCYATGKGVSWNIRKAVEMYRKAAEQGYAPAQCSLGEYYEEWEENLAEAAKLYRKAAEQGNAKAQAYLGVCYERGQGVSRDEVEAVEWYHKAAEQGDCLGQYRLGLSYAYGKGITPNAEEAVAWYRKVIDQQNDVPHAGAYYELGVCYEYGMGVTKDKVNAIAYYRTAALAGSDKAKKALSRLGVEWEPF